MNIIIKIFELKQKFDTCLCFFFLVAKNEAMIRSSFKYVLSAIFVILFLYLILFKTAIPNKRYQTKEMTMFLDGSFAEVSGQHSKAINVGNALVFDFMIGKNQPSVFEWERHGIKYFFKNLFIPIVYAEVGKKPFIVVIDRETNPGYSEFKLYSFEDSIWREITISQFPKQLAVQNTWLSKADLPMKLQPKEILFKLSLTGKLWLFLEKGVQCSANRILPNEFYEE